MTITSVYTVHVETEGNGPYLVQITDDLDEATQTAHEIYGAECDPERSPEADAWVEEWNLGGSWYESMTVYRVSEHPDYVMPKEDQP